MSGSQATRQYRKIQVETSSKDELLVLLLDGGVRFTEGALLELEKRQRGEHEDLERRHDLLLRAQKIVAELMAALSPAIGPDLHTRLLGLYSFIFRRLFEGNVEADLAKVRDALVVFKQVRDMWREAVQQARLENDGQKPARPGGNSTISCTG